MKSITKIIGIVGMAATVAIGAAQWEYNGPRRNDNRVFLDHHVLEFKHEEHPYWAQGTMLVPFRALAAKLGARVGRSKSGERVWIEYGPKHVEFVQGHVDYWINNQRMPLATTSEDRGGILFVPIALFTNVSMNHITFDRHGDRTNQ